MATLGVSSFPVPPMPPTESLFQRLLNPPPSDLAEPLPPHFHVPLQQHALRQVSAFERALTASENEKWADHHLLAYVLGTRGDTRTPRVLSPAILKYLNEVNAPESELPATRFVRLLCERISPFDRLGDLRTKESRFRFYLDFSIVQNLAFRLSAELLPDFIWNALGEENTDLARPPNPTFPLSYALAHLWRKVLGQIPFQPENADLRARFLTEFLRLHAEHGFDPRLITPALAKAIPASQSAPAQTPPSPFILSAPAAVPRAPQTVNFWVWDDTQTVPAYLSQRMGQAVQASGVPAAIFHSSQKEKPVAVGPINLFLCAPDHLSGFMLRNGLSYFEGRKNIGYCSWDTSRLPDAYRVGMDLLDEIWVASPSQQKLFAAFTKTPVEVVPLPISNAKPAPHITRKSLNLEEDAFVFLQVFEAGDSLARKNITGVITAFQHAFLQKEKVRLLIKMRGHTSSLSAREEGVWSRLKRSLEKEPRIIIWHEELNDAEQAALISVSDAVVSLHRACGFGATLLEAAQQGKPIITSACGGPMDYLPENTRIAIPVVPASVVFDVYMALDREIGHRWHDPDLAEAAKAMQRLYKEGRGEKEKTILPFDAVSCGKRMAARLTTRKEEAA
jgi:glycosyltransferase involved in cell wall biosynthesis